MKILSKRQRVVIFSLSQREEYRTPWTLIQRGVFPTSTLCMIPRSYILSSASDSVRSFAMRRVVTQSFIPLENIHSVLFSKLDSLLQIFLLRNFILRFSYSLIKERFWNQCTCFFISFMNWETAAMPSSFITRLFAYRCCFSVFRENSIGSIFALCKRIQMRNPISHWELQFLVWFVADSACPNKLSSYLMIISYIISSR